MKSLLRPQQKGKSHELPQIIAILSGSLAGIGNGLLCSWTSPAIPELVADNSTNISLEEASYFTVISPISMAITAPFFPMIVDAIGRKKGLLLVAVPQILSWILTFFANSVWWFYAARFVSGIGNAALFATSPIYVCEIAEPKVRGSWRNVVATSMYLGIFLMNVIGAYNNIATTALICTCCPILHVLIFMFMPESPYFLLMKGNEEKAKEALRLLRWRADVDQELVSLKAAVQRQVSESGSIKDLFTIDSNRKALLVCMGMRIAQQFCGLPAFEMYTQYMFQQAGGSVSDKISAIVFSGTLVLSVALSAPVVVKLGRKPLMIFSSFGCGVVLTIETIYFALVQFTDLDLSCLSWLPLSGMLVFIVVCATGLGILPTLVLAELFSASMKGKAGFVMNVCIATCLLVVPKLFQTLTYSFGIFAPFCFFTICCYASGIFSYFCVIETEGKTLEEIQQELKKYKSEKNGEITGRRTVKIVFKCF